MFSLNAAPIERPSMKLCKPSPNITSQATDATWRTALHDTIEFRRILSFSGDYKILHEKHNLLQ